MHASRERPTRAPRLGPIPCLRSIGKPGIEPSYNHTFQPPYRSLTRRCSGLATLAAELLIVRPLLRNDGDLREHRRLFRVSVTRMVGAMLAVPPQPRSFGPASASSSFGSRASSTGRFRERCFPAFAFPTVQIPTSTLQRAVLHSATTTRRPGLQLVGPTRSFLFV